MNILEIKEMFRCSSEERIVLSYCFKSIDFFYDVSSRLTDFDFLDDQHQMLFALMKDVVSKGVNNLDFSMIVTQAQSSGVIDLVGGVSYIQSISNIVSSEENFNKYIEIVKEASTKYKLYLNLKNQLNLIEENSKDGLEGNEIIGRIETSLLDMSMGSVNNDDPINLSDGLDEFIEERINNKIDMTGLPTGYPILDRQIDGLIPGSLTVVAARKKMGKSTFLTNIALHVAYVQEKPVLYIDTELSFNEWRTRALAVLAGVPEREIKHGGYNREQRTKIEAAKIKIARGNIFHKYMPGYSVEKVVALCKKMKLKEDIGLIVFDYIKEPDLSSTDGSRKEHQLLGDITTKLKDLAGTLEIPALSAVQLNRQNDIADSDRIARFGDVIALWGARTEEERTQGGLECGNYKLTIKDTRRGGSTGKEGIGYWFFKQWLTIREVRPAEQYFMHQGPEVTNHDDADEMRYHTEVDDNDDELA